MASTDVRFIDHLSTTQVYEELPRGVYRTRHLECDGPFYPVFYYRRGEDYFVSSSVRELILHKGTWLRNPRFFMLRPYRHSHSTLDLEIRRASTDRTSTRELRNLDQMTTLGARLIQRHVASMEALHPGYAHILMMGGKDSANLLLARRTARWFALSGEPDATYNREFIERNGLGVEEFVRSDSIYRNDLLEREIRATDCLISMEHIRFNTELAALLGRLGGKAVIWWGYGGDIMFCNHPTTRAADFFKVTNFTSAINYPTNMQCSKNLFDVPVACPYSGREFVEEYYFRFDPAVLDDPSSPGRRKHNDIRYELGRRLAGRDDIWFPKTGGFPAQRRQVDNPIRFYARDLAASGVKVVDSPIRRGASFVAQKLGIWWERHSGKRRTWPSRVLHPLRVALARKVPSLEPWRARYPTEDVDPPRPARSA